MGYRSDVAIVIKAEAFAEAIVMGKVPRALTEYPYQKINNAVYWYLEGIKWYEGYDSVDTITAFLEPLLNTEHTAGFIRVGEDFDDIVTLGEPWHFDVHLSRDIALPPGFEYE